jgi:hypothetical protein
VIPVYWISHLGVPARCRWDEAFVEDIISGYVKHPAGLQPVQHFQGPPGKPIPFGVAVFPVADHDGRDIAWFNQQLRNFRRVIVFISSDERSKFTPLALKHRDMELWVMTPRPEIDYPKDTTFIGEGSAWRYNDLDLVGAVDKDLWWFFAGQNFEDRRQDCIHILSGLPEGELLATPGFLQGLPRQEYLRKLASARVAPCPAGAATQDSFRLYEALELGCVPVVDEYRNDGGGKGYWEMLEASPILRVYDWDEFPDLLKTIRRTWPMPAVKAHAWWHAKRRELSRKFIQQCPPVESDAVHDSLTVLIPTSPIPSHPSTDVIRETIRSVRERTSAEILVMVDGVRDEQKARSGDYYEYVRRLLLHCEHSFPNVTPVVYYEHLHQAEMTRRTLDLVDSPFVLFVEHDTPLQGDIPFDDILTQMHYSDLNLMRFSHESRILDVHHHLIRDLKPWGDSAPFVPTLQWSQRPHVARRSFYRHILEACFSSEARSMIEDVMHGITEHDAFQDMEAAWEKWRLGVYHPSGNIQRSNHLDGRKDDPKFPMHFAYPEGRYPDGAPWPTNR